MANYNAGPAREAEQQNFEINKTLYKDTVRTIDYFLQKNSFEKNNKVYEGSEHYQKLRSASAALSEAFSKDTCSSNELNTKFREYFSAANYFMTDENNKTELTSDMKKETYANKYVAASMISGLQALYYQNNKLGPNKSVASDYDTLRADAMKSLSNDSIAKKKALETITKKETAEKAAEKKVKDGLLKDINSYEKKFFKCLPGAAKKADKGVLAEALGQFLYIESVKNDAENLSSKVMASKLNKKNMKDNTLTAAYYAEEALENIEKMDPNALQEKLYNVKDPQELITNFKQLREQARQNALKLNGDQQPEQEKAYAKRVEEEAKKKAEEEAKKKAEEEAKGGKENKKETSKSKGSSLFR